MLHSGCSKGPRERVQTDCITWHHGERGHLGVCYGIANLIIGVELNQLHRRSSTTKRARLDCMRVAMTASAACCHSTLRRRPEYVHAALAILHWLYCSALCCRGSIAIGCAALDMYRCVATCQYCSSSAVLSMLRLNQIRFREDIMYLHLSELNRHHSETMRPHDMPHCALLMSR